MEKISGKKKAWLIVGIVIFLIGVANLIAWLVGGVYGIKAFYLFISDQILGIKWLNTVIESLITAIFGATFAASLWGKALIFFLYDSIKIFFLLSLLIFIISYIQSYFPPEKTKVILSKYKGIGANIMGALLGTVTPFCSCSSIPLFMGFTRAGISSGVTFSFLISSPLVDLGAFILLASVFGFPIAGVYVIVGLILAVIGGTIIEKTGIGLDVREYISKSETAVDSSEISEPTKKERAVYALDQLKGVIKKVWIYIFIGVAIGATIHNFVPTDWVEAVLGQDKWYSVFVATFVGVPMYADIFGTIPVAEALFTKGVGVGTILAFMMSVTALSLPSMIMLSKAVKPKLLAAFIAIVVVGIIAIGFAFNALGFLFV
ncbi:MAG TPA: permease [Clostridia bacterium]|nr:permease [Clostridia bacterium]